MFSTLVIAEITGSISMLQMVNPDRLCNLHAVSYSESAYDKFGAQHNNRTGMTFLGVLMVCVCDVELYLAS